MLALAEALHTRQAEIQRRFFRTGMYTFFHLETPRKVGRHCVLVGWKYEFADLGSFHNITKTFHVRLLRDGTCRVREVSKRKVKFVTSEYELLKALFDHYESYLKCLYRSVGLDP